MRKQVFCLLAVLLCTLASCSQPIKGVGKATGRLSGLRPAESVSADFQKGYHTFTFKLLKELYSNHSNMFVSPASLYIALGMTANGANNDTLAQMLDTMGVSDSDILNAGCRDLQSLLSGNTKKYFLLSNAIWLDEHYKDSIKPEFLKRNEDYFGALVAARPFNHTLIPTINQWAEKNTDGMVKNILKPPLGPDIFMFLTNALLFDGKWEMKFKKGDTFDGIFHGYNGDISIPMMRRTDKKNASWYEDDLVQVTLLDYQDKRTAMLIALPKTDLDSVMTDMTSDTITSWIDNIEDCESLALTLPRFSLTYKQEMIDILRRLGITDAFDEKLSDFSRMTEGIQGPVFISDIIHQTALEVDESGTRAAAVSISIIRSKSATMGYTMVVDRPFLCAIVDKPTGCVLFAGTVTDPQLLKN